MVASLTPLRTIRRRLLLLFLVASHYLPKPNAKHVYLPNGLLEVNADAGHPILELIDKARKDWQHKLDRASKTLDEAVREYKRRYGRPPPKGFDDWWEYVQENGVLLPDEYDLIHNDLEPFWGISPEDLLEVQARQETIPDVFILEKNATHDTDFAGAAYSTPYLVQERALLRGLDEILDLLDPVENMLPHFRAIFSPHDNPNLLSDYNVKEMFLAAARQGGYVDMSKLPEAKHYGFASACRPGSPGRLTEAPVNQFVRPPPRANKTFIHNHQLSMDPCTNPYIFYHHGQYVAHDLGPPPQPVIAAQFAYCSTPLYHDIQPPTFIAWTDDIRPRENDPPWDQKTDERLMWRGSNTGIHHNDGTRWIYAQRIHLVRMANELNGTEKILMPRVNVLDGQEYSPLISSSALRVGKGAELPKSIVNPAMMDISFTGHAIGCDQPYCDYLETLFEWKPKQNANGKQAGNHKYLVDVDGNGWSSRFKRLITSNSLVFKATAYPEWWLDRIQPWVHYVPIQVDYSDLYDAYVFFRGGLYGEGNHDDMAREIAEAGRTWSKTFWRKQDMTAYFFRLILEYARIMSLDRDSMSYKG
ncbi:glycosyl transferase family 90-domain-containing protein [Panaeolus papilionaceus]|nr:glycosyl transferase family 90-domain-containing protein [Panaeolus papilionaceus]